MEYHQLVEIVDEILEHVKNGSDIYTFSKWKDKQEVLAQITNLRNLIFSGDNTAVNRFNLLFGPTGSLQELSIDNGWGNVFLELASRWDEAYKSTNKLKPKVQRNN